MKYDVIFKELNYAGVKVLIYSLTHEEKDHIGFGRWLGLEYSNAIKTWKRGLEDLEKNGYMKDGKWTKKVKEIINR